MGYSSFLKSFYAAFRKHMELFHGKLYLAMLNYIFYAVSSINLVLE